MTFLFSCLALYTLTHAGVLMCFFLAHSFLFFSYNSPPFIFDLCQIFFTCTALFLYLLATRSTPHSTPPHTISLSCSLSDPGAVVETHSAVPYAVIGGVLALLVFTVICVLIVTIWCSVRQKGNKHTHTQIHSYTKVSFPVRQVTVLTLQFLDPVFHFSSNV